MSEGPALNTDRELYREDTGDPAGSYYENSVHVTESGAISMNVGGYVIVQPIADWHAQAKRATTRPIAAAAPVTTGPARTGGISDLLDGLEAAATRCERAWDEVDALCQGTRQWTMRVPAEEDRDSDCVIVAALEDHRRLIAALRAVLAAIDELDGWRDNAERRVSAGFHNDYDAGMAIAYTSAADRIRDALEES